MPEILATVIVQDGNLVSGSAGVSFNPVTGIVQFPNHQGRHFVPVVSDYTQRDYITETHYVREIGREHFMVWRTPLDTSGRNSPPINFTAIAVAF